MESVNEKLAVLLNRTWICKGKKVTVSHFKVLYSVKVVILTREGRSYVGTVHEIDKLIGMFVPVPEKKKVVQCESDMAPEINDDMQILESRDYERFGAILGNRPLNKNKIEKIVKDVTSGLNMLPYYPVIVSENSGKLLVIDGQHRLEVSKRTDNPVYYLVCGSLDLKQIAQLNSRGEKWKPADFLNCYINLGIDDYVTLRCVVNRYHVGLKTAYTMLMFEGAMAKVTDEFQAGNFRCEFYDETIATLDLMEDLFAGFDFVMDRNLIKAIQVIKGKGVCDFDRLKKKIQASGKMERMTENKKYLSLLNEIYNHGNHKAVHIY